MKKYLIRLLLLANLALVFACGNNKEASQLSGKDISITWKLVANGIEGKDLHKFILHIENKGKQSLDNKNWELYFSHSPCRNIYGDSSPAYIKVTHINGDFFKITPTEKFESLVQNGSIDIPFVSDVPVIKYSDAPRGFYFIFKDEQGHESEPQIVTNYNIAPFDKNLLTRGATDIVPVPTVETKFMENLGLTILPEKELPLIIPTPLKATYEDKTLNLTPDFEIHYSKDLKNEADFLSENLNKILSSPLKSVESDKAGKNVILLEKRNLAFSKSPEAYTLNVSQNGITISGNDNSGVLYGIQSLKALFPVESFQQKTAIIPVRNASVEDAPQYAYRGMQLDVVRHFHKKENILKLLDLLSFYKINKFRMHLADDEGWRLEIKELPELTEICSKRGHTKDESNCLIPSYGSGPDGSLAPGNGYYTKEDFIEILKYAKQRNIDVIPGFDIPGHARAAIKAMDVRYNRLLTTGDTSAAKEYLLRDLQDQSKYASVQLFKDNVVCPCEEGIYNFINTVIGSIKHTYSEAGLTLTTFHIGADEVAEGVWTKSPACDKFKAANPSIKTVEDIKKYFFVRVNNIFEKSSLVTSSYEDAAIYKHEENGKTTFKLREDFPKDKMQLFVWNNVWGWGTEDLGYRLANDGFPIVLSNVTNLYFDMAYSKEPEESGLYWGGFNNTKKPYEYVPTDIYKSAYVDRFGNPIDEKILKDKVRLTEKGKSNIRGIEGLLWSETLKSQDMLEWYAFPKVIAMAERAWAQTPAWSKIENKEKRITELNKSWNVFANALGQRELPRLDYINGGINYMIPTPGAKIENGIVKANVAFPGLSIRYTLDGSEPTTTSPLFDKEFKTNGPIKLATFTKKGRASRVVALQ